SQNMLKILDCFLPRYARSRNDKNWGFLLSNDYRMAYEASDSHGDPKRIEALLKVIKTLEK
ncbi:MAG: hypothetical protein ABL867_11555, partial [Rickettsiales bacterium]